MTSAARTAGVVELYTSEGCSSCPSADRELSQLTRETSSGDVIALGLHVTYWDELGWKDGLAQRIFDARQQDLAAAHEATVIYTPQFFLNGREIRLWRGMLPALVREANAKPAPVTIELTSDLGREGTLTLEARVTSRDAAMEGSLYLVVTEDALVSHVLSGENEGVTLTHDNAVRVWLGPIALVNGGVKVLRQVRLSAQWNRTHLRTVAFVQDTKDNILQGVSASLCDVPRKG
ncbi:MAG: hypothetical protein QOI13_1479 [Paraburkholderia sp.]|nr:hypothetical protein [Paraburkholderia sp.]